MYYVLFYTTAENYIEKRVPYRGEHLQLAAQAKDEGLLILGGALADPPDLALLIFQCDTTGPVENFVKNDPYIIHGVVTKWEIRPWTVVVGNKK